MAVLISDPNAVVTCERKLFQNYFTGSAQLVNIFSPFVVGEIILK